MLLILSNIVLNFIVHKDDARYPRFLSSFRSIQKSGLVLDMVDQSFTMVKMFGIELLAQIDYDSHQIVYTSIMNSCSQL